METVHAGDTLLDMVIESGAIGSTLPEKLQVAVMNLKAGERVRINWTPDDEVGVKIAALESRENLLKSAFAAKEKFNEASLIKLRSNLIATSAKIKTLVSESMAKARAKYDAGLKIVNKTIEDRKIVISGDTKLRRFYFTVAEKPNLDDEVDAILAAQGFESDAE